MANAKRKLDYFFHYCDTTDDKITFALEKRFFKDGYIFYNKLKEILGSTDELFYNCNDPINWDFLVTKSLIDEKIVETILNYLADSNIIDFELWQARIIWMQSFTDRHKELFRRRAEPLPIKPNKNQFCKYSSHTKEELESVKSEQPEYNDVNMPEECSHNDGMKQDIEGDIHTESPIRSDILDIINNNIYAQQNQKDQDFHKLEDDQSLAPVEPVKIISKNKKGKIRSLDDIKLHNFIKADFIKNHPETYFNHAQESEGIYRLIAYARHARALNQLDDISDFDFIMGIKNEFLRLRDKVKNKIFIKKPCTPSIIASRLLPHILESMKKQMSENGKDSIFSKEVIEEIFPGGTN